MIVAAEAGSWLKQSLEIMKEEEILLVLQDAFFSYEGQNKSRTCLDVT